MFPNVSLFQPRMRFPNWYRPNSKAMALTVLVTIGTTSTTLAVPSFIISEPEVRRAVESCLLQASLVFTPGLVSPRSDAAIAEMIVTAVMFEVARKHVSVAGSNFIPYVAQSTLVGRQAIELNNYYGNTGGSDEVDFALTAMQFTNPFNAFSAAKAWFAAPWASGTPEEIVYQDDPTLPVLSSRLYVG